MDTKFLDKRPARLVGLMQAAGVAMYIGLFASTVSMMEGRMPDAPEIAVGTFMITTFVFSALLCGSLILGYPVLLALDGKKKRAVEVVFWSAASLLGFLLVFAAVLAVVS